MKLVRLVGTAIGAVLLGIAALGVVAVVATFLWAILYVMYALLTSW